MVFAISWGGPRAGARPRHLRRRPRSDAYPRARPVHGGRRNGRSHDIGELVIYLNDGILIAPAMLLAPEVRWSDVDARSFDVALTDHGRTVKARVFIDERGAPIDFETTDRFYADPRDASKVTRCRWTTPIGGFQDVGDRLLPTRGQAIWHPPEGELAYADFTLDPSGGTEQRFRGMLTTFYPWEEQPRGGVDRSASGSRGFDPRAISKRAPSTARTIAPISFRSSCVLPQRDGAVRESGRPLGQNTRVTDTIRLARPARTRVSLRDDTAGATPLDLPARRMWPAGLLCAGIFAIFAAVAWTTIARISTHDVRSVFDLMFVLFESFWVLGWSVAVVLLGALTVLLFFYGESARVQHGQLVHVARLGPLKIISEYGLQQVRHVRLERTGSADRVQIRFDYEGARGGIGDTMPRPDAERLVEIIQRAAAGAGKASTRPSERATEAPRQEPAEPPQAQEADPPPPSVMSLSGLALIGANLVPLAGVVFLDWDLASVIVLFWAESAVVGFYTVLKMAIVGKLAAIVAVPFFIGHFGGFMAGHFLLIYSFFVRGPGAVGPEPGVRAALAGVFVPLWPALVALFVSHGVSFYENFLKRQEYAGATTNGLMTSPYNRIIVMQITLILGGWVILLLGSPVAALALLVVLKTVLDFSAHRTEHGPNRRTPPKIGPDPVHKSMMDS